MYSNKYILKKIDEFNHHNPIYEGVEGSIAYPAYFNVGERGWFLYIEDGLCKEFAHRIHTSIIQQIIYLRDENVVDTIVVTTENTRFTFKLVSE